MTTGRQYFTQNMPTQTVAGRLASGAGPVEALTLSDLATQVALALINNTVPQSFTTLSGSPSTPATWGDLVGTIEAAQTWTIGSSVIYTAAAGGFFASTTAASVTWDNSISFYSGVLWANEQSGGNPNIVDVFNFTSGTPLIYQHDFAISRAIHGAINQQSLPPGRVAMEPIGADADATMYFMNFSGTVLSFPSGLGQGAVVRVDEDDSVNAIFVEYINSSHRIGKWTSINFPAHTATLTQNLQDPGNLALNSCCVDSRCYIRIQTTGIGWLHTTTSVLTTLKTFANSCSIPLICGQFGGGPTTLIYVQSGDTNKANKLQKRNLDGALQSEATLTSVGVTDYNTVTTMAYDPANDHVWVQSGAGLHCIQASKMVELSFIAAASLACQLIQPIGYPGGGAFAFTDKSGSYYTTISRLSITAS